MCYVCLLTYIILIIEPVLNFESWYSSDLNIVTIFKDTISTLFFVVIFSYEKTDLKLGH